MTPYIKDEADLTKVPVTFTFNGKVEIKVQDKTISNGTELDLSKDLKITLISNEKEEEWTIQKPILSNNPVLRDSMRILILITLMGNSGFSQRRMGTQDGVEQSFMHFHQKIW